ncbi:hypothetical protein SVAN01_01656 [Stagonosporopsis vannaccii]|nr:hypothetical protein SVAN01_01656 [Stagonosporopsis vannaccii]
MSNPPASTPSGYDSMLDSPSQAPEIAKPPFVSSSSFSYESVAQSEQDDRQQSTESAAPGALKRDARTTTERAMLIRRPFHWWFAMPMDLLVALTPLFFLIIAGLCLSLDKKRVSKYGEDIKAITLFSPTVFPIIYAAILGKLLRRIALFKAERTSTLGTIERLVGCQSLFSTFERQFAFRRVDLLGLSLLVAWILSPVGGQSSLRLLSTKPLLVPVNDTVKYFPIEGYSKETHITSLTNAEVAWPLFAPLYMTALLTSRQYLDLPMDQFSNIKIPDVFQLGSYSASAPNDTWFNVPESPSPEYTSIIGIPIAGLPETGNTSFSLASHYWSVDCEPMQFYSEFVNDTLDTLQTRFQSFSLSPNTTLSYNDPQNITHFNYQTRWITSEYDVRLENNSLARVWSGKLSRAACRTYPLAVQSQISCSGRSCAVKAMKRIQRSTEDIIDRFESSVAWFFTISANMPGADQGLQQTESSSSELMEHWMMDPQLSTLRWDRSADRNGVQRRWVNIAELPTRLMSKRLQVAINTFWQSSIGSTIMMGNLTKAAVADLEQNGFDYTWNSTALLGSRQHGEQYACNVLFAVLTIAISLLLFVAAVTSAVLGVYTTAPDTLGFVSTSARDNPYVTTPIPSHLDGLEAARALQHVRVRIGDVNSGGDVGHVAFASIEAAPERVSRKRLYD